MKIAFLPIDNRPVCYTLPKLISEIDKDIKLSIPDRKDLGSLTMIANIDNLFNWLENLPKQDAIILSLDTLCYGGLIPSRRSTDSFEILKKRLDRLKSILIEKEAKVYAFSSIMRISNNNYNEEEKEYWSKYGKKIFEYSFNLHKNGEAQTNVPIEILEDYLSTRERNFKINKIYQEWKNECIFNTLVFSKDDCAEFGLNVKEANELTKMGAFVKTGADEIPLSLLSRAISGSLKICPIYTEPEATNLISNYEDVSIAKSVEGQIELAGCEFSGQNEADIILYVNNFKQNQGEIVMKKGTEPFSSEFKVSEKPYMIADVRFANGSDNNFVCELLKNDIIDKDFYGYSAWNTSANTLGSLICGAKIKYLAQNYNKEAFKRLQLTRFLDDWAYQANVRQNLKNTDPKELNLKMKEYEKQLDKIFTTDYDIKYSFPWNRLFEVEIEFN